MSATNSLLDTTHAEEDNGGDGGSANRQGATLNGKRGPRGPLGTDGDALRGHYCKVCDAYVVRSDHHCPFLGVCVGAHNQVCSLR